MAMWIVFGVIGLCAFCGSIGKLGKQNSGETNTSSTGSARSNGNANANIAQSSPTPPPTFAQLKDDATRLLAINQSTYDFVKLDEFDAVMQPLKDIPKDSKDYKEAQSLHKKLIDRVSVIAAERIVLGNKPENSAWDGSVRPAENYLKEVLNDYSSSEYLGWTKVEKIYQGKEPYWQTSVRLRAKNAFGAYIVRDVTFWIRNNQVVKVKGL